MKRSKWEGISKGLSIVQSYDRMLLGIKMAKSFMSDSLSAFFSTIDNIS